ncbi:BZ3500_MvSof-1268-A1-R1_C130g00703 [Microbotryum saponariae]|uniref:BZ3500_MvSof-1268-A1-R1_C130g00703 protein n=1 Tax=Microbotryum saponariae TaxID=289078 RepID=A0A2X0LW87_9BASI|nr:BZ3500_MvSof-1268-A1-R1_C130g00703 [Microbotryum saponariae]
MATERDTSCAAAEDGPPSPSANPTPAEHGQLRPPAARNRLSPPAAQLIPHRHRLAAR